MLFRFDDTEIPGLFSGDGYVWIGDRSPQETAELILERYAFNTGKRIHEDVSRVRVAIDRLPAGGRHFVARQEELRRLDDAWADAGIDAISIVAWGGVGKSALVDEWLKALRADNWRGARRVYGWSFYSQGTEERLTSADAFVVDAGSFFLRPWDEVVAGLSEGVKAWLLNQAGFELRALGRLTEAVQPMEATVALLKGKGDWKQVAIGAGNISELSLTLGDVARAVTSGEESVELADKSGDDFQRMLNRTTLADALHQAGRWEDAAKAFREAEAMQAESQPSYPRLYSLQGYRYCDLLLGPVRRHGPGPGAWSALDGVVVEDGDVQRLREACEDVRGRAEQTLEWAKKGGLSLLTIALDNLSLGRAHFGLTLCGEGAGEDGSAELAKVHLDRAVEGLRASGQEDDLPRGLLARATFRRVHVDRTSAEADLDEAEEIAERGQMPLHLADVYLERTRLHLACGEDVRARVRLDAAAELVERCGYGRRRPDVAFLEAILRGDPSVVRR